MRLHTKLTSDDVYAALSRAKRTGRVSSTVVFDPITAYNSKTHPRAYEIQLGTFDSYLPFNTFDQHGRRMRTRRTRNTRNYTDDQRFAATWHEWGWFIAEIFAADPSARWGGNPATSKHPWGYFSEADFSKKTSGLFNLRTTAGSQVGGFSYDRPHP
jgi:hypothetical protein